MTQFDLLVAGGGPAGVITAITVAKQGYAVVIIDKKERDKIGDKNCGDALDEKHVEQMREWLGIDPPSITSGEAGALIRKISIAAGDVDTSITAFGSPGYIVDRLVYGQRLLKYAEEAGVTILDGKTVVDIIVEKDMVVGVRTKSRKTGNTELRAKICVDATGYTGKLRKLLPKSLSLGLDLRLPDKFTIATYREIVIFEKEHGFQDEIVWLYIDGVDIPGYLWIFTEGERKLNIGITWDKSIPYPQGLSLKELYHQYLDPYFPPDSYEVLNKGGGNIPMRPNFESLVFNGLVLVGDAGCLVDPTTFEGHGPALESGYWAGKACIEALEGNSHTYRDLWSYNCNINDYLGMIHAQSYVTANLLKKIGVDNMAFLIRRGVLSEEDLVSTFKDDGEMGILTKLKKLFLAFPRWRMLLSLVKTLDTVEKIEELYSKYPRDPDMLKQWITKRDQLFTL